VDRIIPGFSAAKSGLFQVGDEVILINDSIVQDRPLEAIKQLTIGEEGSTVTVDVLRGPTAIRISLQRRFPEFTDSSNMEAHSILASR
jgi:C-terminal processing protease CtpA/Prc